MKILWTIQLCHNLCLVTAAGIKLMSNHTTTNGLYWNDHRSPSTLGTTMGSSICPRSATVSSLASGSQSTSLGSLKTTTMSSESLSTTPSESCWVTQTSPHHHDDLHCLGHQHQARDGKTIGIRYTTASNTTRSMSSIYRASSGQGSVIPATIEVGTPQPPTPTRKAPGKPKSIFT